MENKSRTGQCLCGSVKVKFNLEQKAFSACHCGMCRKWGGGPALAVSAVSDVKFTGEESISTYDSSAWAERGFCKKCGTHLFCKVKEPGVYILQLGLIDNIQDLQFQAQIFFDRKPANYSFADKTETLTEAQFLAQFAPK